MFNRIEAGLVDGKLRECGRFNGSCSESYKGFVDYIETSLVSSPMKALDKIVQGIPGSKIIAFTDVYFYAKIQVHWTCILDHLEFRFDHKANVIHYRSVSGCGFDFGRNKRRMQRIVQQYLAERKIPTSLTPNDTAPWVEFPGYHPADIFWRQRGEAWIWYVWYPMWNSLNSKQQQEYLDRWDAPPSWRYHLSAELEELMKGESGLVKFILNK
jgi:uncharacterized protein (DUF1499 family)